MEKIKVGNLEVSQIALGCMRISALKEERKIKSLIETAIANGINLFDHADIYGEGACEEKFGNVVCKELREKIIIQSKCGIVPKLSYNFSKEHIINSVDKTLSRLKTDYLDILLLHRPDTLMDEENIATAFDTLEKSGKVRYFGVSNQNSAQIALMNKFCNNKILINQMQLSIPHCPMIDSGLNVNMENELAINRDVGLLEYCRLNNILIQAWSPFQSKYGVFIDNEKYLALNEKLKELAKKYNVSKNAIAIAWISRHPAKIQTILGTTNEKRIVEICAGSDIRLTIEEWYALYMSTGKKLP